MLEEHGQEKAIKLLMARRGWSRGSGRGLAVGDWPGVLCTHWVQLARGASPLEALQNTRRTHTLQSDEAAAKWLKRQRAKGRHLQALQDRPLVQLQIRLLTGKDVELPAFEVPNLYRKSTPRRQRR